MNSATEMTSSSSQTQESSILSSANDVIHTTDFKVQKDEILSELSHAIELDKNDKVLEAYRYLLSSKVLWAITEPFLNQAPMTGGDVNFSSAIDLNFTHQHVGIIREIVRKANIAHHLLKENHSSTTLTGNDTNGADSACDSDGWIHTGVYLNPFPTEMSYKLVSLKDAILNTSQSILECKCVSVIPASLLQSLLAVMNETELYKSWVPSFTIPKFGMHSLIKTKESGRVGQELNIVMDVPWPLKQRGVRHLDVWAFDDIDYQSTIGIKIQNISMYHKSDAVIDDDVVDMHVDGGFLIRPCPKNHPILLAASSKKSKHTNVDPESSIIVTFSASVDPKISAIPTAVFNFFTKVAFKQCWKMLLQIAMDVQNNKRLDHSLAIQGKKELYDWIDSRLQVLLSSKHLELSEHNVRHHHYNDQNETMVDTLLQMMTMTSKATIS